MADSRGQGHGARLRAQVLGFSGQLVVYREVDVNWEVVEREAVELLSEYLRIDNANPPGNETEAVELLGRFLKGEGFEVQYLGKDPARMNLLCRASSDRDPHGLMLHHHCDVVGANAEEWSVPPFGGVVKDGYVWGRGALDMKGMGVMQLMAFVLTRRERLPLKRDLLLVASSDEERGSAYGAEYLAGEHPREMEAAWVLTEGGGGSMVNGRGVILCGIGEKGPLRVRVVARGRSGHGSRPHDDNPCNHLVRALNGFIKDHRPLRVLPEMRAFLEGLGLGQLSLQALDSHPVMQIPHIRARFQDTVCLTMIRAGSSPNVIPERAEGVLDIRVLPDKTTQEVFNEIKGSLLNGAVRLEYMSSREASSSPADTELFETMKNVAAKFFPDALFLPAISPGFTDSRCFRRLGMICHGWIPGIFESEDLERIHGVDERIRIDDLVMGTRVIYEMIKEMCVGGS